MRHEKFYQLIELMKDGPIVYTQPYKLYHDAFTEAHKSLEANPDVLSVVIISNYGTSVNCVRGAGHISYLKSKNKQQ